MLERLVALLTIGMAEAISRGTLSTAEAGQILFSPMTMRVLSDRGAREDVVDLVHTATEIEDVESVIPGELTASLDALKEEALKCLEAGEAYDFNADKWIALFDGDRREPQAR